MAHMSPEHPKAGYPTWRNFVLTTSCILHRNPTQEPPLSPLQGIRAQRTEGPVQASGRLGTTHHAAQSRLAVS